ncbi:acylcarnitine hydrolase [Folsomia candida]|uniref:acylcarnitine hydrolase n=1 Tax=Folsomia candida TaxID=158441 RepID=UPI000B8F2193|nr:acylcarnitine hydrolase [Folsomia candida]
MNVMTGGEGGCRGRGGKVTVLLSLLLLPLLPHEASPQGDTPVPTVTTSLGTARGKVFTIPKTHAQVVGYLGLPYAQAPINDLRFRPPMELESWGDGPLDATNFRAICFQPGEQKIWDVVPHGGKGGTGGRGAVRKKKLESYAMSEDCLTLNIYVPLNQQKENNSSSSSSGGGDGGGGAGGNGGVDDSASQPLLPVLFFIHGGSYYMNAGRLYPGQVIASSQHLVVVTFNYRLGPLGFLSTGDAAASGNYGLLDQAIALDWVHQHIHHFRGDPGRVTLVGNSAGAASVMFHMFSGLSKGKFVGVTVQSGCSGAPWAIQANPRKHAEALATKLGCPTSPTHDLVDCVRNFSPQLIMKHAKLEDGLSLAFATVVDGPYGGKFLKDHPEQLIRTKDFQPVPILTGFTRDEVTIWFTKFGPTTKTKDLRSFVQVDVVSLLENLPTVTQANMAAMIHSVTVQYMYRAGIGENDTLGKTSSISDFISDVGLKAPCVKEMNLLSHHTSAPIYLYEFHYFSVDDFKMGRQEWIGAYHESEIQYIFGEPYLNYSNHLRSYDDKKMSDLMMKVWGNFIKHGSPSPHPKGEKGGLKFTWTNYTEFNQEFAVLSLKPHMDKFFLTDRMLFWNFFFPIFRDYPFRFEGIRDCGGWEELRELWVFWLLLSLTFALSLLILLLLSCLLRCRKNKSPRSPPQLTNSNNLPLVPR